MNSDHKEYILANCGTDLLHGHSPACLPSLSTTLLPRPEGVYKHIMYGDFTLDMLLNLRAINST